MNRLVQVKRWGGWPAAVLLAALIANAVYLQPGGPSARGATLSVLEIDEGTVLYDSLRIATGEVMYRDFFEFQGPVFYYTYAALFKIVGPSMGAARALHVLITSLATLFIAILVARMAGRLAGTGAAAIHLCAFVPLWPVAYPHWYAETLALGALVLLTDAGVRRGHRIVAGALLALAANTILSVGLPLLVVGVAGAALPGLTERRASLAFRQAAEVLSGALAVAAIWCAYFAACGALGDWWYATVSWPFSHYMMGQRDTVLGYGSYLDVLAQAHQGLPLPQRFLAVATLYIATYMPLLIVPAFVVAFAHDLPKLWRRQPDQRFLLLATAGLAALLPLLLHRVRADLTHVAFVGGLTLPGIAGLLALLPHPRGLPILAAAVLLSCGSLTLASRAHKTVSTWRESRSLPTWREWTTGDLEPFLELAPPGAPMVVGSGYALLYHAPSAISFTFIPSPPGYYYTEAQWRKIAREISEKRPLTMLLEPQLFDFLASKEPLIRPLYQPREMVAQRRIYRLRDAP